MVLCGAAIPAMTAKKHKERGLCTTYLIKMHIQKRRVGALGERARECNDPNSPSTGRTGAAVPDNRQYRLGFFLFKPVEVTNHYIQDTQDVCIQISNATFDRCYSKLEEEDEPRCSPLRVYKNATMFLNTPSSQIPATRSTTERSCRSLSLPPSRIALPPPTPPRRKAPLPPSLSR